MAAALAALSCPCLSDEGAGSGSTPPAPLGLPARRISLVANLQGELTGKFALASRCFQVSRRGNSPAVDAFRSGHAALRLGVESSRCGSEVQRLGSEEDFCGDGKRDRKRYSAPTFLSPVSAASGIRPRLSSTHRKTVSKLPGAVRSPTPLTACARAPAHDAVLRARIHVNECS